MTDAQPTLRGRKVHLRPWQVDDADAVFDACQDDAIQRWTTVPSPYRRSDAIDYVTNVAPAAWKDGGAVFAVIAASAGRVAGTIGAHNMSDGVAHIGYWTAPEARGQGLTSEALRLVTRWFMTERGAARVDLAIEPANVASVRVAERAGFVFEGILRQRLELRERRIDVAVYSVIPSDLNG
ncbi:MAG TPA: GNAT family N-acetyltransferase [Jatrophihabitantaceae bacterium]